MGDFNFRVDLNAEDAKKLAYACDYPRLLEHDQVTIVAAGIPSIENFQLLIRRKTTDKLFAGFWEMDISFAPTYKYDVGTNIYDTRYFSHEKAENDDNFSHQWKKPNAFMDRPNPL